VNSHKNARLTLEGRSELREVGLNRVIECDSTVFDEQHDGARGHQLRVRKHAKDVVVAQGHNRFAVGKAVAKHVHRSRPRNNAVDTQGMS